MPFKSVRLAVGLAVCLAVFLAMPAWAHHSHGAYVAGANDTHLEGVVQEVRLINPHSWIYVEVKNEKGEPEVWALEATGPAGIERSGVKKGDVRAGDTIKVRCNRLKDGSNGCLLGFVTPTHGDKARGDGIEKDWDGPRAGADPRITLAK